MNSFWCPKVFSGLRLTCALTAIACSALLAGSANGFQEEPVLDLSTLDTSIRIQDDLFLHVNGSWLENTKIPEDKSNYGSFGKLADMSQLRIKEIIENTTKGKHEAGTNARKIADFYTSFMSEEKIEDMGFRVLEAELAKIDEIDSIDDVWSHFGYLSTIGVSLSLIHISEPTRPY